jgi:DNA-binding NarL/FixJ family response regulator
VRKSGNGLWFSGLFDRLTIYAHNQSLVRYKLKFNRTKTILYNRRAKFHNEFMENKIKVLIIESETLVKVGVRTILSAQDDIEIAGEAETSEQGFELFRRSSPDVTLMSLRLNEICAVDEIEKFLDFAPKAKIIVLASRAGDSEISRSLQNGAFGYVLKNVSENDLLKAVRTVAAGRRFIPPNIAEILSENFGQETLTPSETKILQEIVAGKSNKEIARDLKVSENTVKTHVKNVFEKLGVSDRTTAATLAIRRGLVRVDL